MNGLAKGLIGAGFTSLLAYGAHVATGEGTIDRVQAQAQSVLADSGVAGVELTLQRDPLARVALVTGISDPAEQMRIEEALLANGNVRAVVFEKDGTGDGMGASSASAGQPAEGAVSKTEGGADGGVAAQAIATGIEDTEATTGASAAQVADCQSEVNAFLADKTINFRSGSAYISPASARVIDGVAERLTACTGMSIEVGGHTDTSGAASVNMSISQARADRVSEALVERGVAASRITATGYGATRLLMPEDGANAANRRTEFILDAGE